MITLVTALVLAILIWKLGKLTFKVGLYILGISIFLDFISGLWAVLLPVLLVGSAIAVPFGLVALFKQQAKVNEHMATTGRDNRGRIVDPDAIRSNEPGARYCEECGQEMVIGSINWWQGRHVDGCPYH